MVLSEEIEMTKEMERVAREIQADNPTPIEDLLAHFEKIEKIDFNGCSFQVNVDRGELNSFRVDLVLHHNPKEVIHYNAETLTRTWTLVDGVLHFYRRNISLKRIETVKVGVVFKDADYSND